MTDTREQIASTLSDKLTRDSLEKLIDAALSIDKDLSVMCKCGRRTPVKIPDIDKRVSALTKLLDQAHGAPKQTVEHQHVSRLEDLYKLDDNELAAFLGGDAA